MQDTKLKDCQPSRDIAAALGVHKATINRIAAQHELGVFVGNQRVFTKADVRQIRKLCRIEPGNPHFGKKTS